MACCFYAFSAERIRVGRKELKRQKAVGFHIDHFGLARSVLPMRGVEGAR
jgi:hypothetical protein